MNVLSFTRKPPFLLGLLLAAFLLLQSLMPLGTAIRVGADEGFEYGKATLYLKGYHFYTEIWNDQPLLHTVLISQVLKHISASVLGPRLVTSAFALLLLGSVFVISLRIHGLAVATVATALLIASPGFLELGSSCMVEIPGLAPVVAGLGLLLVGRRTKWRVAEVLAGVLFAVALQIKFIGAIYLPLAGLILWVRQIENAASLEVDSSKPQSRRGAGGTHCATGKEGSDRVRFRFIPSGLFGSALAFGASLAAAFFLINLLIDEGSYWLQLRQSWAAHFASARSFEYGSPAEHPFDWSLLFKNWDITLPATVGILVALGRARRAWLGLLPLAWLALTFVVFGTHKPWWSYYYVHNAVPLCLCAAAGLAAGVPQLHWRRARSLCVVAGLYALCALSWMSARLYLQIDSVRQSPQIYSALVLKEIDRYKPYTKFLYAEEPIYSFHAGIPLPPQLAVVSLKRFWSGDLTNAQLVQELVRSEPGVVLLTHDTRERPFQAWLQAGYRLVYQDADHQLYARRSVIQRAEP